MARTPTLSRWLCAGLVLLTVLFYGAFRQCDWIYEDFNFLAAIGEPATPWTPPTRALTMQVYHGISLIAGREPELYRGTTLALHALNGVLVYAVALALPVSAPAALWATGIFLLHPLNSEAVRYATALGDVLVTTWLLLAVWLSLGRPAAWRWLLVSVALLGAAVSKETGLIGLPLVALTLALLRSRLAASMLVAPLWMAVGVIAGLSYLKILSWVDLSPYAGGSFFSWPEYALLQLVAVWRLLALVPWPDGFSIDHDVVGLAPPIGILAVLATIQAVALVALCWRRAPLVAWSLSLVAIALAPRFLFQTNEFVAERQMMTAMVGVSILVGAGTARLWAYRPQPSVLREFLAVYWQEWTLSGLGTKGHT